MAWLSRLPAIMLEGRERGALSKMEEEEGEGSSEVEIRVPVGETKMGRPIVSLLSVSRSLVRPVGLLRRGGLLLLLLVGVVVTLLGM